MRRKEVAIRLALGATRRRLASVVLSEATGQTVVGLVLGTLGGIAIAARFAEGHSVLTSPPVGTIAVAAFILAVTIVIAAVGPVRRVWRVDSAGVLREEV